MLSAPCGLSSAVFSVGLAPRTEPRDSYAPDSIRHGFEVTFSIVYQLTARVYFMSAVDPWGGVPAAWAAN